MNIVNSEQQQWEAQALADLIDLVKAPNGDFGCIARLSKSLRDTDSLQLMVEFLSRNLQGRQALQERPLLGSICNNSISCQSIHWAMFSLIGC